MKLMTRILQTRLSKILIYKYLFYKYYYKFIFLHKPLCERYKSNTIKLFGLYICRSCLLLYTGFFIGLISVLSKIKTVTYDKFFFIGMLGAFLTILVSYPPLYAKFSRISKDFIRFYDGLFLGIIISISFKISINTGVACIALFYIIKQFYNKKRSGARICAGCPELEKNTTCSGYKEQKQALLNLDEEYSNILTAIITNKERM